jgi:hypothetical protein
MEIYTYLDASLKIPRQGEIFFHWYRSWKRRGWEPRLLHPRTWRKHPYRHEFKKILAEMFHDDLVEQARAMAMLAVDSTDKAIFFSDYDVVNFGLAPEDVDIKTAIFCKPFRWLWKSLVDDIVDHYRKLSKPPVVDLVPGCVPYGHPEWRSSSLVHFSRAACQGERKHLLVESCGRNY